MIHCKVLNLVFEICICLLITGNLLGLWPLDMGFGGSPPFGLTPIGLPPIGLPPIGLPPFGLPPIGGGPNL